MNYRAQYLTVERAALVRVRFCLLIILSGLLLGCQTAKPPEFGMVDWYVANGTGNAMTLNVYDKICERTYYRVRIPRQSETAMSTCANQQGNAEIRYTRAAGYSVSANPTRHDVVSENQSLLVD